VARVDPADDSIRRFVVYRYGYDPDRHERRHRLVAAYDNVAEFERALEGARETLTGFDRREHWTGTVKEPGADRRARAGHFLRRCIEHGAQPPDDVLRDLDENVLTGTAPDDTSG
jgi:hypothetical protein